MQFLARFVHCWPLLFVGRYVSQLSGGLVWSVLPVLLNEISTVELRGSLGLTFGFFANFSVLLSTIIGLDSVLGTHDRWPYIFLYLFIHTIIGLLLLLFVYHESPEYAVDAEERAASYQFYQHTLINYHDRQDNSAVSSRQYNICGSMALLCHKRKEVQKAALVSFALTGIYTFSGNSVLLNYSTAVFMDLGFSVSISQYLSVGLKITAIVASLICFLIVDRVRRRKIIFTSLTLILICFILIVVSNFFSSILAACLVYAAFSLGYLSIQPLWYVVISELFHLRFRMRGKTLALQLHTIITAILTMCFYILLTQIHSFVFLCLVLPLASCMLYLYFKLPETKDRTEEEIIALLSPST